MQSATGQDVVQEIRDLVQELSEPHLLCRYVVVLEMARQLSSGPLETLASIPMNQTSSWQRGFSPKIVGEDTAPSSTIRCVIDFLGLKKIERLPERPLLNEDDATIWPLSLRRRTLSVKRL